MKRGPKARTAACHPERRHHGNGLCKSCHGKAHKSQYVRVYAPRPAPARYDFINGVRDVIGLGELR